MNEEILIQRSSAKSTSTFPTEMIDLPSHGHFYPINNHLSSGQIELKSMTAKEEDILTSPNLLKKGLAIDKLIESLIVDKEINVADLLLGDKNALIFAIRRLAYGDTYGPVDVTCTKCSTLNQISIDLSLLKEKEFDDSKYERGVNEFEFTLPTSKIQIKFKLMTDSDEKSMERDAVAMLKIKKDSSTEITSRLKRMIVEVNGDRDVVKIKSFVDSNMLSKDSFALRQHIKSISPDINTTVEFCCKQCNSDERVGVPMTVQFFWPDTRI